MAPIEILKRAARCRLARFAAYPAVGAAAGLLLLATGLGLGLDQRLAELRDEARARPASGEVHLVEIDGRSISALRRWPWPRSLHGAAVDKLREANVRSITFDIDFSSVSTPAEDASFAAALARAGGGVVLPTFSQRSAFGRDESIDAAPIAPLAENAFLATANVMTDADGALRRMPYGGETFGIPRPSLASLIAERTDSVGDSFAIDYAIDPASIPRHSFVDLIEGRIPPSMLAGRRIVIGSTAVELGDHYSVPRHGMLPGALIQAIAAETLIAGTQRHELGAMPALLAALLLIAGTVAPGPGRIRLGALAAGAVLLPTMTFAADLYYSTSMEVLPALAALAAAGAMSAAALRRKRDREVSRVDAETGLPNLAALEDDVAAAPDVQIVVARIAGFASLSAALGPEAIARLLVRLADRLQLGTGSARIYRSDETGLAWIAAGDGSAAASLDGLAALARDQQTDGRRIELPLHFGIASGAGEAVRRIAANAALAASQAERSGVRWHIFTDLDSAEVSRSVALMGDLDSAFGSGQIRNHYQPKLDLASGLVTGVEALVRWHHPQRGMLAPDSFVSLIEENGRARDLTVHVLKAALDQGVVWREERGLELSVAVNVSASLLGDAAFMSELQRMVRDSRLPADLLTIEVTETAAMASPEAAIAALEGWRRLGAGVSIDDFGTGQSSLGYIRMLPATELKIDRSFVGDVDRAPRNAIMVRSTIAMAHELGLQVVAEGVEDEACLQTLKAMRCDLAQGYLIARPCPGDEIEAVVLRAAATARPAKRPRAQRPA